MEPSAVPGLSNITYGTPQNATDEDVSALTHVTVYNQSDLEAVVVEKARRDFINSRRNEINKLEQRISSMDEDLNLNKLELEKMEHMLDALFSVANYDTDPLNLRKIRSLESQIETKMRSIDNIEARKQSILKKLNLLNNSCDQNTGDDNVLPICSSSSSSVAKINTKSANDVGTCKSCLPKTFTYFKQNNPKTSRKGVCGKDSFRSDKRRYCDDANLLCFQQRLKKVRRSQLLEEQFDEEHSVVKPIFQDGVLSQYFKVPASVWSRLYEYQKRGVQWLWDLHQKRSGCIIGDEMGLGKTIQVIAFFAGLHYSGTLNPSSSDSFQCGSTGTVELGSSIIVCPATVLHQWMSEFHSWWPAIRVAILHSTGSGYYKPHKLIQTMANNSGSVLLTTYSTLVAFQDLLLKYNWSYIILDEGHKIKNPDAEATLTVKLFSTPHRIILSGSPIQNNLKELWSLFDFVCPGRLGPLPEFMQQFSIPITQGGYATASPLQVETAYQCVCTLRDLLKPYLIRRLKMDVQIDLPSKSEQVLFCRLTEYQRTLYKEFLQSQTCKDVLNGRRTIFPSLILLRNLCNHPDFATGGPKSSCFLNEEFNQDKDDIDEVCLNYAWSRFGCPRRSSKMMVVTSLLRTWYSQGHKVLLFSQSRKMLTLLERLVKLMEFRYLRMDGSTPIAQRKVLIQAFNNEEVKSSNTGIFVFLLTTRVGGLGINLTAANRVLIYDPDWNPTTDLQARERAWRIGQKRNVVIYRLLSSGTIEEKIYHRQIFKQFLTNRVLKNPRQQRFFKTNDLEELFSLSEEPYSCSTKSFASETAMCIYSEGLESTLSRKLDPNNRFDLYLKKDTKSKSMSHSLSDTDFGDDNDSDDISVDEAEQSNVPSMTTHTEDRRKQLLEFAKQISHQIAEGTLDETKKIFHPITLKHKSKKRNKTGIKVDGKRINLIEKHCKYDTGNGTDLRKQKSHNNHLNTNVAATTSGDINEKHDAFIETFLHKSSNYSNNKSKNSPLASMANDEDIRNEAARVAKEALEHIQKYQKPGGDKLSTNGNHERSNTNISGYKKHLSMKLVKHQSPKQSKSNRTVKLDNPSSTSKSQISAQSELRLIPKLVTHTVKHDTFLDLMTQLDRTDISLDQRQAERLALKTINSLLEEMRQQNEPYNPSSAISLLSESSQMNKTGIRSLGLVRNRFLWNPIESVYTQPTLVFNTSGDLLSEIQTRLTSSTLLGLIRLRKQLRESHSIQNSSIDQDSFDQQLRTKYEIPMRCLCIELIRLFYSSSLTRLNVTNELLQLRFGNFAQSDDCSHTGMWKHLTNMHFHALLNYLTMKQCTDNQSQNDDTWILRQKFQPLARYLSRL